jgi:hypothetical protein
LPLLVPGVGANHKDLARAADNLAVLADALDAGSYFHGFTRSRVRPGTNFLSRSVFGSLVEFRILVLPQQFRKPGKMGSMAN